MAKKKHTHKLAKAHGLMVDGERVPGFPGDPCTPTEAQLRNMPDVFLLNDGTEKPAPRASSKHGLRSMSVTGAQELIARTTEVDVVEEIGAEEAAGRDRVSIRRAVEERIEDLENNGENEGDGDGEED